jgi:hypothetical protein
MEGYNICNSIFLLQIMGKYKRKTEREIIKIHRWDNWKCHRRLEVGESMRSIAEDLKLPQASLHVTTVKFRNTCKFTSVN